MEAYLDNPYVFVYELKNEHTRNTNDNSIHGTSSTSNIQANSLDMELRG